MTNPPMVLINKLLTKGASFGVAGDAEQLRTAYEAGQPVTLGGKLAGEVVYLGHTRQTWDDGVGSETIGLDRVIGEAPKFPGHTIAVYLVDMTRLDGAPKLAETHRKAESASLNRALAMETRARNEEHRMTHDSEDGA